MVAVASQPSKNNATAVIASYMQKGPGPGRYMLPPTFGYKGHDFTRKMEPAYSIGQRIPPLKSGMFSPGPIYFINAAYTRNGPDGSPHYSMLARPRPATLFITPGPDHYFMEKVPPMRLPNPPKYSMASRNRYRIFDSNPAPNNYVLPSMLGSQIPNKESSASYSISGRTKMAHDLADFSRSPGCAHYSTVMTDLYKNRAPAYYMGQRVFPPEDRTLKPGPGAYSPEKVVVNKPQAPAYSTGIRHSEFTTPLITKADAVEDYEEGILS